MQFDPYRKWLGIPPAEQPADHYRLLAIARFESDPDVIEGAADRQMGHVRTFQAGQHSALSQKILNELAAAKVCLLNADKKAAYDAELRQKLDDVQRPQAAVPMAQPLPAAQLLPVRVAPMTSTAPVVIVTDDASSADATHELRSATGRLTPVRIVSAAVAILAIAFVGYLIYAKPHPQPARNSAALSAPKQPSPEDTDPQTASSNDALRPNGEVVPLLDEPSNGAAMTTEDNGVSIDLLAQMNLKDPTAVGEWRMENGRLIFPQLAHGSIPIYAYAPDEYELTAKVQCSSHAAYIGFGIVVGKSQAQVFVDGYPSQGMGSGLALINGLLARENGSFRAGRVLIDRNALNVVQCTVTRHGTPQYRVQLACNGVPVVDWVDDPSKLSLPTGQPVGPNYVGRHRPEQLFICLGQPSPFEVTELTLRPLGAVARGTPQTQAVTQERGEISTVPKQGNIDGWAALFNGKDLTGWYEPDQNKGTWQVVDGILIGRGAGTGGNPAWLATRRRDFTDFQLRLELLSPPIRGQVIVRAPAEAGHPFGYDGYRVALVNGTTPAGQVFQTGALGRSVGWPVAPYSAPATSFALPQGPYVVEMNVSGKAITSYVEGTKVAEFEDSENHYSEGEIRIYCGFDTELRFRRIELKELPPVSERDRSSLHSEESYATKCSDMQVDARSCGDVADVVEPTADALGIAATDSDHKSASGLGDPEFERWLQDVQALPAEKQVPAVVKKLRELNPGFPGNVTQNIENGAVTEMGLQSPRMVKNILPVRALRGLRRFTCRGSPKTCPLSDLSPLAGINLSRLDCSFTKVSDLSPLVGMHLTSLDISGSAVLNLSMLQGVALTELNCSRTAVADLSPVRGAPLTNFDCSRTRVTDLSVLKGMPLGALRCSSTEVADLSPLNGMPLRELDCSGTSITDLSPLKGMSLTTLDVFLGRDVDLTPLRGLPLQHLRCNFLDAKNIAIIRSITNRPRSFWIHRK